MGYGFLPVVFGFWSFRGLLAELPVAICQWPTASIADVTSRKDRSKGMAIVGIAFGLGFVLGPALGGYASSWDWSS
jgi:MFS family permease